MSAPVPTAHLAELAARLRTLNDPGQIVFQLRDWQAAQRVVPAERDDQDADVALERPIEPGQAARRRGAALGIEWGRCDPITLTARARRSGVVPVANIAE